jgi:hypothetical protein
MLSIAIIVILITSCLFTMPLLVKMYSSNNVQSSSPFVHEISVPDRTNYKVLSFQPLNSTISPSGSIELGYGPNSIYPVNEQIPIYTTNDQMWVESTYNYPIVVQLFGSEGQEFADTSLNPKTITQLFEFNSTFPTSNLSLVYNNTQQCCFNPPITIPVQFVSYSNNGISSLAASYELSNATLSATFTSPDLSHYFSMQACFSNSSSSEEVEIPLPTSYGEGFIGLIGDPNTTSAELVFQNTRPLNPFSFSFQLFANYTLSLPTIPNQTSEYISSELEVASSSSSTIIQTSGQNLNFNMLFSNLAGLRSGRYVLKAFFQNSAGIQEVDTQVLMTSPYASSWFWLGNCQQLGAVGAPKFSISTSLASSAVQWPRYLYLMYQSLPGIEGFANTSLGLNLNEVNFQQQDGKALPSDIQVSTDQNPAIETSENSKGDVYMITNGSYPLVTSFTLSFGGKAFSTPSITLDSPYETVTHSVALGELFITVTQGKSDIRNASITISSSISGASYSTETNQFGVADVFLPQGNYTVTVMNGNQIRSMNEMVQNGAGINVVVAFAGQVNYESYLIWVISIVTAIGAIGNAWFWFLGRRIRRFRFSRKS